MSQLRVVLIEPEFAGNMGSVARAMGNMGFSDLCLVKPKPALDEIDCKAMAMSSYPILAGATVVDTVKEALADCHWAFGFTRRSGKHRREFFPIHDLSDSVQQHWSTEHKVAFVFGREKSGFKTEEAAFCQQLIQIPSSDQNGSLNLSQAVMVALYEIRRSLVDGVVPFEHKSASIEDLEGMYEHLDELLEEVHYFDAQNRQRIPQVLRRLLNRAQPNDQEVRIVRGMCRNALYRLRNGSPESD